MFYNKVFTRFSTHSPIVKRFVQQYVQKVQKERKFTDNLLWETLQRKKIQSINDWKQIRNEILDAKVRLISPANIDAMTVGICISRGKYDLALSYLDFLKLEKLNINLATLGKHFRLLYIRGLNEGLSLEDEENILAMYDDLRKSHPILDALTLANVIQAISLTKKWKLCIELLEAVKITTIPTSSSYSAIIAAAFSNNADEIAWNLFNEMLENNKTVQDVVYTSYFARLTKASEKLEHIEKMLKFMQTNCIKLESAGIDAVVESLKALKANVRLSKVHTSGVCKGCNQKLALFELTDNEFNDLKSTFIENVIVGRDVYQKTTSEELAKFTEFISRKDKFDVIIDGLNVAYSIGVKQSPNITSGLIASVVSHFVKQGKRILVLGRKHMNKYPRKNWGYVQENATVFLTENLSQDDPYLLYCALNSGKDTIIITRDLMRSHKFLLKEVRLKLLFERWLLQRQYILLRVEENGNVIFKKPLPFSQMAQKNGDYWHIPSAVSSMDTITNNRWLCIKL